MKDNTHPFEIDFMTNQFSPTYLFRYEVMSHWCKDKKVLDAACGYGYGSNLLKIWADEVDGMDIDNKALSWGKNKFNSIGFFKQDLTTPNKKFSNRYDTIVSIETFEHLPYHSTPKYINNLIDWVKEGGTIIITTPKRNPSIWLHDNEKHLYEYSYEEFYAILEKYIKGDHLYFGISEVKIGDYGFLTPFLSKNLISSKIMVGVINNVCKH